MPYAYYARLKPAQRAIYRASDQVSMVALPDAAALQTHLRELEQALHSEQRTEVQRRTQALGDALLGQLGLRPVAIRVLARRPSHGWGELHGEYEPADDASAPRITLWMRTAQQQRIVAFKTYLRTLLHELGHHLDYTLLKLRDSYHTEGFFKRESSLFKQLMGHGQEADTPRAE
jgi:hypothetical protein